MSVPAQALHAKFTLECADAMHIGCYSLGCCTCWLFFSDFVLEVSLPLEERCVGEGAKAKALGLRAPEHYLRILKASYVASRP